MGKQKRHTAEQVIAKLREAAEMLDSRPDGIDGKHNTDDMNGSDNKYPWLQYSPIAQLAQRIERRSPRRKPSRKTSGPSARIARLGSRS